LASAPNHTQVVSYRLRVDCHSTR